MLNGCSGLCIVPASEGAEVESAEELPSEISHFGELWVWLRDWGKQGGSLTCAHVACTNTNMHMYQGAHACIGIHMHAYTWTHTLTYAHTICAYTWKHTCTHIHTYTCTLICTRTYTHIQVHTHIHIYIYEKWKKWVWRLMYIKCLSDYLVCK